jgi:hypothetical protein
MSRSTARSYVQGRSEPQRTQRANNQIFVGTLLILGGTILTFATLQSPGGGTIFYGAIAVGLFKVFRGLSAR